jgi:Tfp pilus assembly protein PilN
VFTKLNLATHPFRNRTLPHILAAFLVVLGLGIGMFSVLKASNNQQNIDRLKASNQEKLSEIERLKGEGEKVRQLLTPDQRVLLNAAHKLVANKRFGWSRLFADLESVLPGSVSASRIAVQNIYQDADRIRAELEMSVVSRDYPAVMSMIDNMNNSGLFQAELRGQDLQKKDTITVTEYTFHIIYTPTYTYDPTPVIDVADGSAGGQR